MIVNVTTLGSGGGGARASVGNIVNYLEGNQRGLGELTKEGSEAPELEIGSVGGYYADSGGGRWIGEGARGTGFGLEGGVDRESFERLLMGQDPNTGEQLMHSAGSSRRSSSHSDGTERTLSGGGVSPGHSPEGALKGALSGNEDALKGALSLAELANGSGLDDSYLRKIARRTMTELEAQEAARSAGMPVPNLSETHLVGFKEGRVWMVEAGEADRFLAARNAPQVVHGYDITFSVPKSVSVLWAASEPDGQRIIEEGLAHAVDVGMGYLEDEGFWARSGRGEHRATGMTAAAYTHETSRAMEPQLHTHVVVPNMAWNADGGVQAVDARGLYAHATPAGHLADAAMRNHLTRHLGVEWEQVEKGSAEIRGVPKEAIREMSSRRAAVIELAEERGAFTTRGRQTAALVTRPSKEQGVDEIELRSGWVKTLSEAGLDAERVRQITPGPARPGEISRGESRLGPLSPDERQKLFTRMSGAEGVTKYAAVFDRRNALEYVADTIGGRVDTAEVLSTADRWLAEHAVPLEITNTWDTVGKAGAGRVSISRDQVYSTPEMVRLEQRVMARHQEGLGAGKAMVAPVTTEAAIGRLEAKLGSELGADQAAAVRAITTSGHQFQAVEGLAGAGKTTAMAAAVDAWHQAGYRVVGGAPFGSAAEKLGTEIGIETRTVESLIQRMGHNGPSSVLNPNTVLLVDEASTISNRQLDKLYHAVAESGAALRTIGDPQQHSAVEAGGLWKRLVEIHEESTPLLDVNRRQNPETMGAVREGLETWRTGDTDSAIKMLEGDGRFRTADSWDAVMDLAAETWLPYHSKALSEGTIPLQMIAETNRDRTGLIGRAQQMLRDEGVLGASVEIGGVRFHINDRVLAQEAAHAIKAPEASAREHVLNGSTGVVTGFTGSERHPNLVVDFDRLGVIEVPHHFVDKEVGPGRGGGMAPSYAVTSYKAEGQTFEASLALAAPGAVNKEGMYVAVTRGKEDLMVFSIDPNQTLERADSEFRSPDDPRTMTEALRDSLNRPDRPDLAVVADTGIGAALDPNSGGERHMRLGEQQVAATAIADPTTLMVAAAGERPTRPGHHQQVWDQAVGSAAVYEHRYGPQEWTMAGIPVQPAVEIGEQTKDYGLLVDAIGEARHATVAAMPLEELLAERGDLSSGDFDRIERRLVMNVSDASHEMDRANRQRDRALEATQGNMGNPSQEAMATLSRATGHAEVATAKFTLESQTVVDFVTDAKPQGVRANLIESGFEWRVNDAVEHPARYLIDALGPRPASGHERAGWNQGARMIETVRHEGGLTPNHGPQPGSGPLERAIGMGTQSGVSLAKAIVELDLSNPDRGHEGIER